VLPRGFYDEPELFAEAVGFRGEGLGRWRRGGMMGVGGGGWGVRRTYVPERKRKTMLFLFRVDVS